MINPIIWLFNQPGIYNKEIMEEQNILEVRLVKEALIELLKEQLFVKLDEFVSKEKYIMWQLSKIFSFPIYVEIHIMQPPFNMQISFKVNGTLHVIDAIIE